MGGSMMFRVLIVLASLAMAARHLHGLDDMYHVRTSQSLASMSVLGIDIVRWVPIYCKHIESTGHGI